MLVAAVALAGLAGISYADLGNGTATVKGCVNRRSGLLRIVNGDSNCRRGERGLTLGKSGPQGKPGATGPAGSPGAQGSPGPDGDTIFSVVAGDDCGEIQMAIDELAAGGGAVLVKAGTYTCMAPIIIDRDSVTLRGVGPATVLRLGDHVNRPVLVVGETVANPTTPHSDIRVADLSIDGNRTQQEHECSVSDCTGGDYLRNNGISLRHVEDVQVEDVSVRGARSGGLVVEMGSRRVTVRDFTASDSRFDGLAGYDTEESVFSGLYLHNNLAAGLSFDSNFDDNAISDSVLAGNGDVGVFMRDAADNLFSGVRIRNSFKDGVYLAENGTTGGPALGNTFTGMFISGSGDAAAPADEGYGIKVVDASCTDNLVVATQFVGNRDGDAFEATPGLLTESANITR